jgi:hypothetical protein
MGTGPLIPDLLILWFFRGPRRDHLVALHPVDKLPESLAPLLVVRVAVVKVVDVRVLQDFLAGHLIEREVVPVVLQDMPQRPDVAGVLPRRQVQGAQVDHVPGGRVIEGSIARTKHLLGHMFYYNERGQK